MDGALRRAAADRGLELARQVGERGVADVLLADGGDLRAAVDDLVRVDAGQRAAEDHSRGVAARLGGGQAHRAIASIPTGLPTFVQAMLSSGARRLAEHKAVVKSLSDVETLGGTTVINSDKTGTLTMNAMTATQMLGGGDWFKIEGPGYAKTGAILAWPGRSRRTS